ncbi:hypothetical protein GT037_006518 [Alternaria burnsii]|uniref:Uncharacterized protein n=1 Tax=Alternaria burnsii TaxID=1187904 RepID=A0A8H7B693_9PLEO|nr:uncharacterized protein GT037_006518 [Alternaria burnsii]KAF7675799.1 hypothetical protein GT037_006518 [Alternaria burnsii]
MNSQQYVRKPFVPSASVQTRLCASTSPTLCRKMSDLPLVHGHSLGNRSDTTQWQNPL